MSGKELFSHRVKSEAAGGITGKKKCLACLAGMLLCCRETGLIFQTENKTVRDLFVKLCAHEAGEDCIRASKRGRRSRLPLYSVKILPEYSGKLFSAAGISPETGMFIKDVTDKTLGAFAAGVFLSCGTVVEPRKEYHLEFALPSEELCGRLHSLFSERIGADGGIMQRGGAWVLYFKESGHVEDILTLIGAPKASLELMNVKIYKDLRNHANRATNCDTANCRRQNESSRRQIEAIEKIISRDGGLESLPDGLRELARLRLESPELSLGELASAMNPPLTRSGINHRFKKLIEISEEKN